MGDVDLSRRRAVSSKAFGFKSKRDPRVDYRQFHGDVSAVARHFGIRFEECWVLANFEPFKAAECYRVIARSLRAGQ